MPDIGKASSNGNNSQPIDRCVPLAKSESVASAIKSEDIEILEQRRTKYLEFQNQIRKVISADATEKDALINDVVDAVLELGKSPTWMKILSLGILLIKNRLNRKKLRKVVENILEKIFDIYLDWYTMDYEDLKETCDYIGGKDYFSREDHRHIYVAVKQKLKHGPIRDKCVELGVVEFVNEKLIDIRDNLLKFKMTEL